MGVKIYANLYNHTTHSEGVFSPTELVKVAMGTVLLPRLITIQ